MTDARGTRGVAYFDCPGGGQVVVDGNTAYIGHMNGPEATTIVDVSDPKRPRQIAQLKLPYERGAHAHKVRVQDGLMLTNLESIHYLGERPAGFVGGLNIYDVSDPARPRHIKKWESGGGGVHRFTFDGRYAYISPEVEGYDGNIVMILDLQDPERPEEVGRWWMPGQWIAGGEERPWKPRHHRCHHPIRRGDRLYVSYWHGGFVILDISDMTQPKFVSGLDWSPPFPWPTHTCLPVPFELRGRKVMIVADEHAGELWEANGSFLWLVDITDETRPVPFSTFQVEEDDGRPGPTKTGCHQPVETISGTEIPVAWFARGLRIVDISNPHAMREAARFVPPVPAGSERPQTNDVYVDYRGLIYIIDRIRGMHIIERVS